MPSPGDQPTLPMLVKGWEKKGATASNFINSTVLVPDLANQEYRFADEDGKLIQNPSVQFVKSVPCQGNTVPLAYFTDHRAVEISIADPKTGASMTILFDPSYGTESKGKDATDAAGRLLAWQNQSLDFVGLFYMTNSPNAVELRMQAITSKTNAIVQYYKGD
jgi:hypothetical protein